jgi:hypothetical protein
MTILTNELTKSIDSEIIKTIMGDRFKRIGKIQKIKSSIKKMKNKYE